MFHVFRRYFDRSVILLCVRWHLACNLSLRDLEEMTAERRIHIVHSTIHRRVLRFSPLLLEQFNHRKRPVSRKWHVDETCVKVRGRWAYLYHVIDGSPTIIRCAIRPYGSRESHQTLRVRTPSQFVGLVLTQTARTKKAAPWDRMQPPDVAGLFWLRGLATAAIEQHCDASYNLVSPAGASNLQT